MKVLLTAFEPFGGADTNITQEVLQCLPEMIGTYESTKIVLPVSFHRAPAVLHNYIEITHPGFVLMMGQCGKGETIRLEQYAHNLMNSKMGDNDGYCPHEEIINPVHGDCMECNAEIYQQALAECIAGKLPVSMSTSAGRYVCNRVYYEALQLGQPALFVHIPKTFEIEKAAQTITFLVQSLQIPNNFSNFALK